MSMPIQIMRMRPATVVSYDTDSIAYFAAMSVQPDATRKGLIDALIVGLKADGIWALGDVLHLIASHDAQAAKLNAINPAIATITLSGTPTFTTDRGYLTDGSTNFLDTNRANNAGGNYAQDSASFGIYVNSGAAASASSMAGAFSTNGTTLNPQSSGTNSSYRLNQNAAVTGTTGPSNANGSTISSRTGATAMAGYRNGTSLITGANASTALVSTTFKYGATGAAASRAGQFAWGWIGGGLTPTQAANLHSRLLTFLTAIGAN